MADLSPRHNAPDSRGRFTFRLVDIFISMSVIAICLGVAVVWNIGIAILAGLFAVSALFLFRRTAETRKVVIALHVTVAIVAILGVVCSLTDRSIGLFLVNDVHYYYYDGNRIVLDDMSIHPQIEGVRSSFCIPPLFVRRAQGPPYKVGLTVVDYYNKNKPEKVQITSLIMTCAGKSYIIVTEDSRIESGFDRYADGSHVESECTADVGNWLLEDNSSPVQIEMAFVIHKRDGVKESRIDVTMLRADIAGWGLMPAP